MLQVLYDFNKTSQLALNSNFGGGAKIFQKNSKIPLEQGIGYLFSIKNDENPNRWRIIDYFNEICQLA